MKIPVLTYHAMNIIGNDYADNDHVALAADLKVITGAGFRVAPLHALVKAWLANPASLDGEKLVALTCDDGSDFDYFDLPHPTMGVQRSMVNVMRDFQRANPGAQPSLHITSFVIVSPRARDHLDTTCMIGAKWWNDSWWRDAVASGLMGIASHSWDHNHITLENDILPGVARGTFTAIANEAAADHEIRRANEYLLRRMPNDSTTLLGYPYGETNDFLTREYFPRAGHEMGLVAALGSVVPGYWTRDSDRWNIPRFTSQRDWRSPDGLQRILEAAR